MLHLTTRRAEECLQGRIGEPEDLKGAVIYLASDVSLVLGLAMETDRLLQASAFTTGTDLKVDGGKFGHLPWT